MTITDTTTAVQDQVLDILQKLENPTVDAVKAVVERIEETLPEDRPALPFADQLPDPVELVDAAYGFAQKLLENQHDFAKQLVEAIATLRPATAEPAPRAKTVKAA